MTSLLVLVVGITIYPISNLIVDENVIDEPSEPIVLPTFDESTSFDDACLIQLDSALIGSFENELDLDYYKFTAISTNYDFKAILYSDVQISIFYSRYSNPIYSFNLSVSGAVSNVELVIGQEYFLVVGCNTLHSSSRYSISTSRYNNVNLQYAYMDSFGNSNSKLYYKYSNNGINLLSCYSSLDLSLNVFYLGENTSRKIMHYGSINADEILLLTQNGEYLFEFERNASDSTNVLIRFNEFTESNDVVLENCYVEVNYLEDNETLYKVLIKGDYNIMPDSYSSNSSFNSFDGNYGSNSRISRYNGDVLYKYFFDGIEITGILDSNGNISRNINDDERCEVSYNNQLINSVCKTKSLRRNRGSVEGTCFFVSDSYAFSAAHLMFKQGESYFYSSIQVSILSQLSIQTYDYFVLKSYCPLKYLLNDTNEISIYDWCIYEVDINDNFNHSFLGVKYDNSPSSFATIIGYPKRFEPNVPNNEILCSYSSGTLINNDVYETLIDFTVGNSGGPAIELVNGTAYARGICSRNDYHSNKLSKLSKKSIGLLLDLQND